MTLLPLVNAPFCVLKVVYLLWASVRLGHLQRWFCSWVHESVLRTGRGIYCAASTGRASRAHEVDAYCYELFVNSSPAAVILFRRKLKAVSDVLSHVFRMLAGQPWADPDTRTLD